MKHLKVEIPGVSQVQDRIVTTAEVLHVFRGVVEDTSLFAHLTVAFRSADTAAKKAMLELAEHIHKHSTLPLDKMLTVLQRVNDTETQTPDTLQQAAMSRLNPADQLPPVACPLVIEVDGQLIRAERTEFVQHRGHDMNYRLADGSVLRGRFAWTYP